MNQKIKSAFLILVFVQALHSIEEYFGRLWENFPPATYLCSLVSDNLETGFLIINIGLFVFGLLCWFFLVRKNSIYAPFFIWFWIIIELMNGIVHPTWTIMRKSYTPGVLTAPIFLIVTIYLFRQMNLLKNR